MKINATNSYNKIYEDKEKKQLAEEKSAPIKSRIKKGFCENDDVLNKISEKLLNELKL